MEILIFAETDDKGNLKKDAYEIASYASEISSENGGNVNALCFNASNAESLVKKGLFKNSSVTPAVRMNDTSDIWGIRHGEYKKNLATPFRTAQIRSVKRFANLGLFSVTFSKNLKSDLEMLNAYRDFREEAMEFKLNHLKNKFKFFLV